MPEKLICPQCGCYQENDKKTRQFVRKVSNAGKTVVRESAKYIAKDGLHTAVDAVVGPGGGFLSDLAVETITGVSKEALGKEVDSFMDEVGMKIKSVDEVQYRCLDCGLHWDGYDEPSKFNEVQTAKVTSLWESEVRRKKDNFVFSIWGTVISLVLVAISFWIFSNREIEYITTSTWFGDIHGTNYSWHYYVFWPLVIISGLCSIWSLRSISPSYNAYKAIRDISLEDYAAIWLRL